jgi:hypothetical protein
MGLCTASEIFQELMLSQLSGLQNIKVAIDDIMVYGKTVEEHDAALESLLARLTEMEITLNKSKCEFRKESIEFFGMLISKEGIQPKKGKLTDFMSAVAPRHAKELRSYLGLATYFAARIPNYANVSAILWDLCKQNAKYIWTTAHQIAFETIRELLITKCMGHFDILNKTELWVDSGPDVSAAYLIQTDRFTGEKILISCAS